MSRDVKVKHTILLLNSGLYIGGAENVTASLCRGLDRTKFRVIAAHLKGRGEIGQQLVEEGHDIVGVQGNDGERRSYLTSLPLRRLITLRKIDLVQTNDMHSLVDASLCRLTIPGLKHVHTYHYGNYPYEQLRHRLLEGGFSRLPHKLVAVGEIQKRQLRSSYGLPDHRVTLIRNGVPDVRSKARDDLRERIRSGVRVVIGSVSTLIRQKGISDLLEVAALMRRQGIEFRLVVIGDGDLRGELEAKRSSLGLEQHVEFLGWVEDAARRVLPHLDVFVQTSLWEAMSLVVLEAMSCGRPVVVTAVGENPHVVRDGENGFVCESGGIETIADRLGSLVQSDQLRMMMGARARESWEQRFTSERMCESYSQLYENLLQ